MRLQDQVAIVTGGGQGIGQQIALRLAAEGAAVVIADINEIGSKETADMVSTMGGHKVRIVPSGTPMRIKGIYRARRCREFRPGLERLRKERERKETR